MNEPKRLITQAQNNNFFCLIQQTYPSTTIWDDDYDERLILHFLHPYKYNVSATLVIANISWTTFQAVFAGSGTFKILDTHSHELSLNDE